MSTPVYSDSLFIGPTYALVIGISNHRYGKGPGEILDEKDFSNLKVAAKDASDFADFLRNNGVHRDNVKELLNENASIANIKDAFDRLRKSCKLSGSKDPLVIVYFAGHGMADSDERHYLIPHDAERDRLFGTALLNKDFSALLDHLNTNRLVAFIDACHAGAVGLQNIRGESAVYDSRRELGEGRGRYIIRSCGPDQKSYEGKENGIFTGHLLDLLKGSTEDFDKEEIDTFDLYRVLKDKVRKTAFELYKKEQEPDSEMASATGIVLAINRRLQKKRQDETAQAVARKSVFLDKVIEGIKRSAEAAGQKIIITQKLRDYVDEGQISSKFEQFYEMFDEYVGQNNEGLVDECSVQLVRLHSRILRSSDSPLKPAAATTTSQNGFVAPGEKKTTDSSNPPTPPPIPTIPRVAGEARRQFSSDDSNYILAEIFGSIELYRKARPLVELLSQPVTEAEVVMTIHRLIEDKTLQDPLDTIVTRFQERWPRAESKPAADISDKATVLLGRSLAARKTDNS